MWKRLAAFSLALAAAIWLCRLPVLVCVNGRGGEFLESAYHFDEDDFNNPKLVRLRRTEHLDDVVAPAVTQFDKIVRLRKWAHDQWRSEARFFYPPWDAGEILDLARRHANHGFCAQYAIVFLQACQAMGIHARYIELNEHFITGVWSDEYDRWVLMDPTNDWHFEKDGVPMTGRALFDAYWKHDERGILRVQSDGTKTPVTHADLEAYKQYSIVTRADQLTTPPIISVNGGPRCPLVHQNDFTRYPLIGRDQLAIGSAYLGWDEKDTPKTFGDKPMTDDRDNFQYAMDQTLQFVARRDPEHGRVKLILLAEGAPTFSTFRISANGSPWRDMPGRDALLQLSPGMNTVDSRLATRFGWEGPIAHLNVFYKPAWWPLSVGSGAN